VLSFSQDVDIGTPPTPHSLAREELGESPNSDEGTYTVVLFIYTYFVVLTLCGASQVPEKLFISNNISFKTFKQIINKRHYLNFSTGEAITFFSLSCSLV
jgi:hypothetical protein